MNSKIVEILLVEDNPNDVELTIRALKKHNLANRLHIVGDGAEALEYFFGPEGSKVISNEHIPKVVFLDLKLPKVDGIEVLRRLKGDNRTKMIPVVVLTSSNQDKDLDECYKLGVNSYITKPVEFEAFFQAILELGLYWLILNQPPCK
jgi:two-component system response regulator